MSELILEMMMKTYKFVNEKLSFLMVLFAAFLILRFVCVVVSFDAMTLCLAVMILIGSFIIDVNRVKTSKKKR